MDSVVEDPIRREELVVGDLVTGAVVTCECELEEEAAEAGSGDEDVGVCGGWEVRLQVGKDEVQDRFDFSLEALSRPVAVELAEGGVGFGIVVGFGFVVPELRAVREVGGFNTHGLQAYIQDCVCEVGVGIDGVVNLTKVIEQVEGWRVQELPLLLSECVDVLASTMGDGVVSILAVLAVTLLSQ